MPRTKQTLQGRVWLFGNDVDTDQIIQGRYLTALDYSQMAKHALEIPRPEFAPSVKRGDIVVAGDNFGGGSSREEAPRVMLELGVACVVAESFSRLFYRNAFNIGLPALIVPGITASVKDGMTLEVDLVKGIVSVVETGQVFHGQPLPRLMLEILRAGGAVPWYRMKKRK